MRIVRLFSILDELRSHSRPMPAHALAEKLEVSLRTIYRDMAMLQSMGAPIRGEGGIGYQLEKGYFLPPLHFDHDELDAIILGMKFVKARGDGPLGDAAARAFAKINATLPKAKSASLRHSLLLAEPSKEPIKFLSPLRTALRKRSRLKMIYLDLNNKRSERVIRPLGLTAFDRVWLLTAWCELRDGFRDFRVDRIEEIEPTGDAFPRQPGQEFNDYLRML